MQKELLCDFWLTSDPIDFEYKKYLLLAYEQKNNDKLKSKKIYPYLTDVVDKLMYVNDFIKNLNTLKKSAKEIDRIDWLKREILYKTKIDDEILNEVDEIATYSKAILSDLYIKYKNLYDDVDGSIVIFGDEFSIFDKYSGYLILKYGKKEKILEYQIYRTIIPEPTYHLQTNKANLKEYYSDRFKKNIFEIIFNETHPTKETMIPVMRRKFLMRIMGGYLL